MASKVFVAITIVGLFGQSLAKPTNFLAIPDVKVEDLEADILAELATVAGVNANASATAQHLSALEDVLRPFFAAVPKEEDGTLGHNVVKYVLRRFFAHEYGWSIAGLESDPGTAALSALMPQSGLNGSAPTLEPMQTMQQWAPAYLQSFLEKLVPGRGLSLHELAVLAASLKDLIQHENKQHLMQAYASFMQPTVASMPPDMAFKVLETYMMIYMLGGSWTKEFAAKVYALMFQFKKKVSHWDDTLEWLKQLIQENAAASDQDVKLNFDGALHLVDEIGHRFANFNTQECGRLKSALMTNESSRPGRIRLRDFYKMGLDGAWEFNEKVDFLREIGTLDESDPSTPLVILPNYVQARTNCLKVSSFYAVCCPDECEGLMQRVEGDIASATARPARIAKIVSQLSSPTVNAAQHLSKPLMERLQDIASHHGGEVPIHGRLFAQWMHHAFPRECPYPHAAGTVSPQTADEWMIKTGQSEAALSKEELMTELEGSDTCRFLPKGVECGRKEHSRTAEQGAADEELPWDTSEELLVVRTSAPSQLSSSSMQPLRDLALWIALSLLVYGFGWAAKSTKAGRRLTLWAGIPLSSTKGKGEAYCV